MKIEVTLTNSVGRTLEAVAFSTDNKQVVLSFTDGTFTTLCANRGFDDPEISEEPLDMFVFGDAELVRAGVLTADELEARRKERNEKLAAQRAETDRREFERLKLKLGA